MDPNWAAKTSVKNETNSPPKMNKEKDLVYGNHAERQKSVRN
jgi:hypothetical protein